MDRKEISVEGIVSDNSSLVSSSRAHRLECLSLNDADSVSNLSSHYFLSEESVKEINTIYLDDLLPCRSGLEDLATLHDIEGM